MSNHSIEALHDGNFIDLEGLKKAISNCTLIEKKQFFGITDQGEYIDEVYHEISANQFFGRLIGRNPFPPNQKRTFSKYDIAYEGHLHKQGSWYANWKKRYFIIRKDIKALCYYAAKEKLTLLGSIPFPITALPCDERKHCLKIDDKLVVSFTTEKELNEWKKKIEHESRKSIIDLKKGLKGSDKIVNNWWLALFDDSYTIHEFLKKSSISKSSEKKRISNLKERQDQNDSFIDSNSIVLNDESLPIDEIEKHDNSHTTSHTVSSSSSSSIKKNSFTPYKKFQFDSFINKDPIGNKSSISGFKLCLQLKNICSFQDKLFVNVVGSAGDRSPWIKCSSTEIISVNEKTDSGGYVEDLKVHFSLLLDSFPEDFMVLKFEVYKRESKQDTLLCSSIFNKKEIDNKFVSHVNCITQVPSDIADISIPTNEPPSANIGIIKLNSEKLYQHRLNCSKMFDIVSYSEKLFTFNTIEGSTISLEHIYASKYSIIVSYSLISFLYSERKDGVLKFLLVLQDKVSEIDNENSNSEEILHGESRDNLHQSLKNWEKMLTTLSDGEKLCRENCINSLECRTEDTIIDSDAGGCVLRRSVWKKNEEWQFSTTNLNIHLMSSQAFNVDEIKSGVSPESDIHVIPTITLGCPTAHAMKFKDGGLSRIFEHIHGSDRKIVWMHYIQCGLSPEKFQELLLTLPADEVTSLFGEGCGLTINTNIGLSNIMLKKHELARRIDICSSQILGFALTSIRTVIALATEHGGHFVGVLERSLKIGFLIPLQSLLSTWDHEMGMIEDLELATLWLSLVSLQLVTSDPSQNDEKSSKLEKCNEVLRVRRDDNERLIVEMEVNTNEVEVILAAIESMKDYLKPYNYTDMNTIIHKVLEFNPNPTFPFSRHKRREQRILATVPLFGVMFQQGVNEMQTLAKTASYANVLKQDAINLVNIKRLEEYHTKHMLVFRHQLDKVQLQYAVPSNRTSSRRYSSINTNDSNNLAVNKKLAVQFGDSSQNEIEADYARSLIDTAVENSHRMLVDAKNAVYHASETPGLKHIDVLLKTSILTRYFSGTNGILCKSGKDRTAMSTTLEETRGIVEDLGVTNSQEVCQVIRSHGVRRMNVYANTGQEYFAFNIVTNAVLPTCYKPPPGSYKGSVST